MFVVKFVDSEFEIGETHEQLNDETHEHVPKYLKVYFCPFGPKVWNIAEKRLLWMSVVRASIQRKRF